MACNIIGTIAVNRGCYQVQSGFFTPYVKSIRCDGSYHRAQMSHLKIIREEYVFKKLSSSPPYYSKSKRLHPCFHQRDYIVSCHSTITCSRKDKSFPVKECCSNVSSWHTKNKEEGYVSQFCEPVQPRRVYYPNQGLAQACKFVHNDAKFVKERAKNDIILLSRGLTRLNDRAREDVVVLGIGFMKLDARAREDTEKIDGHMRRKAARLRRIATTAHSKLKNAADQHWNDGALEADLKRADSVARRRAMEDAFLSLKFVKNVHDMMTNKLYRQPQKEAAFSINDLMGFVMLEMNVKSLDLFGGEVSTVDISVIQEAYRSLASALSEANGIDYTDPEELELLVATLIDLDAIDSKSSVSLLAECARSPDVSTRKALANALASAPSMWILGNAGMGALQKLAEDHNPAVAASALKTINELKLHWELEEGDGLRFIVDDTFVVVDDDDDDGE